MYEDDNIWGGPDPNNGICMGCNEGNMYNPGAYGGV